MDSKLNQQKFEIQREFKAAAAAAAVERRDTEEKKCGIILKKQIFRSKKSFQQVYLMSGEKERERVKKKLEGKVWHCQLKFLLLLLLLYRRRFSDDKRRSG